MNEIVEKIAKGCMICGAELVYTVEPRNMACNFCGSSFSSNASCKVGHFVCDPCHSADAVDFIEKLCIETTLKNPLTIALTALDLPQTCLHGPEHHFLVPAVLAAAFLNVQGATKEKKAEIIKLIRARSKVIPGGFCGFGGCCGGAVGCGIFMSVIQGATPLKKSEWALSNEATGHALCSLSSLGGPRCCKRSTFNSLVVASRMAEKHLGLKLELEFPKCHFYSKNKECIGINCPFHPSASQKVRQTYEHTYDW